MEKDLQLCAAIEYHTMKIAPYVSLLHLTISIW